MVDENFDRCMVGSDKGGRSYLESVPGPQYRSYLPLLRNCGPGTYASESFRWRILVIHIFLDPMIPSSPFWSV